MNYQTTSKKTSQKKGKKKRERTNKETQKPLLRRPYYNSMNLKNFENQQANFGSWSTFNICGGIKQVM